MRTEVKTTSPFTSAKELQTDNGRHGRGILLVAPRFPRVFNKYPSKWKSKTFARYISDFVYLEIFIRVAATILKNPNLFITSYGDHLSLFQTICSPLPNFQRYSSRPIYCLFNVGSCWFPVSLILNFLIESLICWIAGPDFTLITSFIDSVGNANLLIAYDLFFPSTFRHRY